MLPTNSTLARTSGDLAPTSTPCVAAVRSRTTRYASTSPFHPSKHFPESPFPERATEENPAYDLVREAFISLGWDSANLGSPGWNPLGWLVKPGNMVLLKPNLVVDKHPRDPEGLTYTITQGSLIRAVADYVAIALKGSGSIVVADAPQTDSSFADIAFNLGLRELESFFRAQGVDFSVLDLRAEEWRNAGGVIVERTTLAGDPRGYSVVDIGEHSAFYGHAGEGRYYGADYDTTFVNRQHSGRTHKYKIANTALECDVFINLPKLKTHKKGGLTCSLKNLVGINGDKNYLPHHTVGSPSEGGDQFPRKKLRSRLEHAVASRLRKLALSVPWLGTRLLRLARLVGPIVVGTNRQAVRSGNWYGNDTTWRMTLDMNRVLLFWNQAKRTVDAAGPRKRYLSVVDAIVAGEGNGPMDPDPREFGVVVVGTNPAEVDAAAAILMGFDPEAAPTIREAFRKHPLPITVGSWKDITVHSNVPGWNGRLDAIENVAAPPFRPHFGWTGRIERGRGEVRR